MEPERLNCLLQIEREDLRFQFLKGEELFKQFTLKAGYEKVASTFFRHAIPNEAEIDSAINFIEDELMSDKELLEQEGTLQATDKKLAEVFRKNGLNQQTLSRQDVENLFTRYARVMMGAPSFEIDAEITHDDVAILLLIREIMHHLDFEALTTTGQQAAS